MPHHDPLEFPQGWRTSFRLKDLLTDQDVPPEKARELAKTVIDRLRNDRRSFSKHAVDTLVDEFEAVGDQDDFNIALDCLYDVADAERVWIK